MHAKPSTSAVASPLLLVTALEIELAPLRERFKLDRDGNALTGKVHDTRIVAGRLGMGAKAGERCAELIKAHQAKRVLLAGFSGGLDKGVKVGQIVTPRFVIRTFGPPIDLRSVPPQRLSTVADLPEEERIAQTMLTADELASTAEQKRRLSRQHQAATVDMEAYHVAHAAAELGVELVVIKAVTDTAEQSMPDWMGQFIKADGTTATSRAAMHALTHPWHIGVMSRMAGASKSAGQQLAAAVEKRVAQWTNRKDARRRR